MKKPEIQIYSMLKAYNPTDVLTAIELYKNDIEIEKTDMINAVKQRLIDDGWVPQTDKPANVQYYLIDGEYWVQTEAAHQRHIETAVQAMKKKKATLLKKTKQNMDLNKTPILCPACQNKMYKQSVCAGCTAGKAGYKIRLICEDNPNHEVLL